MSERWIRMVGVLAVFAIARCGCRAAEPHAVRLHGAVAGVHDPSIIKEGKTWYVFATGMGPDGGQLAVRCSEDLTNGGYAVMFSMRFRAG